MKKITAAKFKEKCLSILDRLKSEGLMITKHGKPVALLFPVDEIIVATSLVHNIPLLTRDKQILKSKVISFW